ncbi:MbeB family mobilization protein [Enterobacter sp. CPE_E1214]|uniref:MbeB family mobilization protein n=1 Tax=Enterobacter sp. CPE_E1214 TaxID=3376802 RepID=UPI0038900B36
MSSLLTLAKDLEQKSKAQQLHTGEMLKAAFSEHEQSVRAELSASAKRISDAIRAHEEGMSSAIEKNRRSVLLTAGRTWLTILMTSALLIATSGGVLWWQGQQITDNYTAIRQQEDTLKKLTVRTWGCAIRRAATAGNSLSCRRGCSPKLSPTTGRPGSA